jgi:SAM-dependent methyltransferase
MNFIDRHIINLFHNDRIKDFGPGAVESLGWPNTEHQLARFEILSGIADLNNLEVLDAGCGYGDLYPYLRKKFPRINYIGIEQNASFLDIALERYSKDTQAKFLSGDFTNAEPGAVDYILCSGALSYKNNEPDFIKQHIKKLFGACRRGLGFNLLSKVKNPDGILVAYNPDEIMDICRQLTPHLRLHKDYLPEDFSVFLYTN